MAQLMLLNPAKRRRARKPRTAAQRAATKRMIAANRRSHGVNPRRRRARRSTALAVNPRRRRRAMRAATVHHRRRARRNPAGAGGTTMMGMVMAGGIGAAGALAVDYLFGLSAVSSMTGTLSPTMVNVAKAAAGVALGIVGGKLIGRATAARMAQGTITVAAYKIGADAMTNAGMTLGYISPAMQMTAVRRRRLPSPGMAQYINSGRSGMGEYIGQGSNGYGY